jgi:hypothetical protein
MFPRGLSRVLIGASVVIGGTALIPRPAREASAATAVPAAAVTTGAGSGLWTVGRDGGVFSWQQARFYGSTGGTTLDKPIVGMAATPDGGGYYLVTADDTSYSFGNAGPGGRIAAGEPIVGATIDPAVAPPSTSSASASPYFQDGFAQLPEGLGWAEGSVHGNWIDQFNGYGTAGIITDGGSSLALMPKASTSPGETHSALVTSRPTFGDLDVTYQFRTVSQLRSGSPPNSWEVAWVLWHETDNQHFYYVLLKPDGWEIGKEDPAYPGNQRFLATGTSPSFGIGTWHQVRVVQSGPRITVWADGSELASLVDGQRPYLTGSLGLYCEDSVVHFRSVTVG